MTPHRARAAAAAAAAAAVARNRPRPRVRSAPFALGPRSLSSGGGGGKRPRPQSSTDLGELATRLTQAAAAAGHHCPSHGPAFPLRAEDVGLLAEPAEFYEAILERVAAARDRVTLSALYLGTGKLERRLVRALGDACRRRPGLKVRILLDHSRARRWSKQRESSVTTLASLLAEFPGQVEVALFRMPQLSGPLGRHIPSPLNEVVAVSHLKALVMDDALILTGANLSHDYFTTRQDRYVTTKNAGALADFYHEVVALLARFGETVVVPPDKAAAATTVPAPAAADYAALRRTLLRLVDHAGSSSTSSADSGSDTLALPTLQCAPLGIRQDEGLLHALLEHWPALAAGTAGEAVSAAAASSDSGWQLTLASAYLNPPPPFLDALAAWPGKLTLLAPSAATHGFAGARSASKAWIPLAYLLHEHRVRQRLVRARRPTGAVAEEEEEEVSLWRYVREGWTFHGKGLWVLPVAAGAEGEDGGAAAAPSLCATVAGSSNYGYRSFERDLESQVLLLSHNRELAARLATERGRLLAHSQRAPAPAAAATEDDEQAAIERLLQTAEGEQQEGTRRAPAALLRRLWLPRLADWTRGFL